MKNPCFGKREPNYIHHHDSRIIASILQQNKMDIALREGLSTDDKLFMVMLKLRIN